MVAESPIRTVLVDDHELFRRGVRELLAAEGIEVIAEAADGDRAVSVIVDRAPDVVVMDIHLPGRSGIEATREVRRRSPATTVLVLSISEDDDDIADAIVAGASGYLLKDAAVEDVAEGVRAAARGESKLSARIAARLLDRLHPDEERPGAPAVEDVRPSERELELLGLVAAGRDTATVADDLGISREEVHNHITNVVSRIQASERIARALGSVEPPAG
ncbi:MAG TPA: response regulator transcription factor [Solirubrobacterales bacterium]|nr:response regulator transcription factor [Solirubrobacterales bacterium]